MSKITWGLSLCFLQACSGSPVETTPSPAGATTSSPPPVTIEVEKIQVTDSSADAYTISDLQLEASQTRLQTLEVTKLRVLARLVNGQVVEIINHGKLNWRVAQPEMLSLLNGTAKALQPGTTEVSVALGSHQASIALEIVAAPLKTETDGANIRELVLPQSVYKVGVGESIQLEAYLELLNGEQSDAVIFSVDRPELFSLDAETGVLKRLKAGTATVTVQARLNGDILKLIALQDKEVKSSGGEGGGGGGGGSSSNPPVSPSPEATVSPTPVATAIPTAEPTPTTTPEPTQTPSSEPTAQIPQATPTPSATATPAPSQTPVPLSGPIALSAQNSSTVKIYAENFTEANRYTIPNNTLLLGFTPSDDTIYTKSFSCDESYCISDSVSKAYIKNASASETTELFDHTKIYWETDTFYTGDFATPPIFNHIILIQLKRYSQQFNSNLDQEALYMLNLATGETKRIADFPSTNHRTEVEAALSPDGQKIAYIMTTCQPDRSGCNSHLYLYTLANQRTDYKANLTAQSPGFSMFWSPDQSSIFYHKYIFSQYIQEIHRYDMETNQSYPVTDSSFQAVAAPNAVSPDSQTLVYAGRTNIQDSKQTYLINIDGTNNRILEERGTVVSPQFSPDGSQILVGLADESGDDTELWLIQTETGVKRLLETSNSLRFFWLP